MTCWSIPIDYNYDNKVNEAVHIMIIINTISLKSIVKWLIL